jgi:hypothetical protein
LWVPVSSGTGAANAVHIAGDGGIAQLVPGSTAVGYSYIQLPAASFSFTAGQKLFFGARFTVTATTMANPTIWIGLQQHQAASTPAPTDGIYFLKANGAATLNLVVNKTSTPVNVSATNLGTLTTAVSYDVGFFKDRNDQIFAFFGTQLFGFVPQSGTGGVNSAGVSTLPVLGPVASAVTATFATAQPAYASYPQVVYPTALLSPMIGILAGDTSSPTLNIDFLLVQKER